MINLDKRTALQDKLRRQALKKGINLLSPQTTFLSKDTLYGKNITIEPFVVIGEKVKIGNNVIIKSFSYIEKTTIENNISIGPYSRLRPGNRIKTGSKVGNFVEIKNSILKPNSKVNHLAYIGDTSVGEKSNIGAGTITCNFDGQNKYKTKIGNKVFIGSNSSLVAPLTIGNNSTVGAGSVITKNVSNNSLSLTRSNQIEKKNYKKKKK